MGRPDTLSRQADHPKGADNNADCTLLTPEVFKLRRLKIKMWTLKSTPSLEHRMTSPSGKCSGISGGGEASIGALVRKYTCLIGLLE